MLFWRDSMILQKRLSGLIQKRKLLGEAKKHLLEHQRIKAICPLPGTNLSSIQLRQKLNHHKIMFNLAMDQLNLLLPEFVINVGDMIEGYTDELDEFRKFFKKKNKINEVLTCHGMESRPFQESDIKK